MAKLFTGILGTRITKWCNTYKIIPEWQSGFREKRGCLDNIFSLNSIIQLHLSRDRGKLYALFIDFKGAFDSISHALLWNKLKKIGIGSKIINVLKSLYSNASIKIKTGGDLTEKIRVTKGVLQGESISPLLFSLFLSDLEEYLLSKGVRGVTVTHLIEVLLIGYADDLVMLADSYIEMKKVLKHLYDYCKQNELKVNLLKTKIVLFQKGGHGHRKNKAPLSFGTELVEYASEYVYLGVKFTQNALFTKAMNETITKAKAAVASTISLCEKLNVNSWKVFERLFGFLVKSIILYAAPVYATRYLQDIEKIQSLFIKRILKLPQCSPDYALRLEVGMSHIGTTVFKQVINWLIKILDMHESRYPKISFLKQLSSLRYPSKLVKYNWVRQIKEVFFDPINEVSIWDNLTSDLLKQRKSNLLDAYSKMWYNRDLLKRSKSSSLILYSEIDIQHDVQKYFKLGISLRLIRIFAQIRFLNIYNCRIIIDSIIYVVNNDKFCYNCGKNNDFVHRVVECPIFNEARTELRLVFRNNHDFF